MNLSHTGQARANHAVTDSHTLSPDDTQPRLRLAFGVHHAPLNAPQNVLRQVESAAQALAVSILAGGHKHAYIAACCGVDRTYVCHMARGKRAIPDKLVPALCAATGSNLLRQFLTLQAALEQVDDVQRLAEQLRRSA